MFSQRSGFAPGRQNR